MHLIRYGQPGHEKPGLLIDGERYSVSHLFSDYNEDFFAADGLQKLQKMLDARIDLPIVMSDERWAAPVARPSKIVCVGLNFADHARESGATIPAEPVLFMKSTTAFIGPYDQVVIPRNSTKSDWEVELAVVVGKRASYVEESDAMNYVAGYCLHNDLSEREFQLEKPGGQWDKGKGCDTFAPVGPVMATTDAIPDPHQLNLWLKVNGELLQSSNTREIVYKVPFLIAYISQFMTLLPGDIISTGTPAGVGLGFNPPRYLKPGDVMELGIDGLGTAKQTCIAWTPNV